MSLKFTILGCGTSTGVPRVDGEWGACDPSNPKNRRRRCALLVEKAGPGGVTTVLIDTGPDIHAQLQDAKVQRLDGVLYTHDHADHTHGIDDLRILAYRMKKRIDVYFNAYTGEVLNKRFDYCFATQPGSSYPPILKGHVIVPLKPVIVSGPGGVIDVLPFLQHHGEVDSLGFRIGGLAYSSDVVDFPPETLPMLNELDIWILDALRPATHPSHLNVAQALDWVKRLQPRRTILTHMHMDLDYDRLQGELPEGVEPAYDGMVIKLSPAL
ncbi:MAG: MBL fold metallo-hydrolase [Hyphomicrobiales bacterium]|nr:MBL fold metallo-hydrolase [Hyphomicrobiales bacterium]